jgi:hypothetical protein
MDEAGQRQDEFATAFELAFARLRSRIETACADQSEWSLGTAAGIRAAFVFAASDPDAVRALTTDALAEGKLGFAHYERLISYLRDRLVPGRAEHPGAKELPPETERALAGGLATLVSQRLEAGRQAELPSLAAEATQFALTPYLGRNRARRVAEAELPGLDASSR